jgi:hypothetical protein
MFRRMTDRRSTIDDGGNSGRQTDDLTRGKDLLTKREKQAVQLTLLPPTRGTFTDVQKSSIIRLSVEQFVVVGVSWCVTNKSSLAVVRPSSPGRTPQPQQTKATSDDDLRWYDEYGVVCLNQQLTCPDAAIHE